MIQTSEGNLPQGLDTAIHTGLERGRRTVARRARVRRGAVRSALCLALVLGLFAGGVNASPAFAAAMEELPILGRLDRKSTRLNSSHIGSSRMPSSA